MSFGDSSHFLKLSCLLNNLISGTTLKKLFCSQSIRNHKTCTFVDLQYFGFKFSTSSLCRKYVEWREMIIIVDIIMSEF